MIGGIMAQSEEERAAGVPPNWLGYVDVANVDESAKRVQQLGGKVLVPGTDIPDIGRFAVIADPQGAVLALYSSSNPSDAVPGRGPGHFSWAELNTTDWKAAWKFYSELFGWKPTQSMGGMSNAATMIKAPAHWLHYVTVPNADEAAKQVVAKGGKVLNGPMDVPGGGRIAQCMDPQGGMFAVYAET
jgi:predicted enzyme related to lactoylglutathione lyase